MAKLSKKALLLEEQKKTMLEAMNKLTRDELIKLQVRKLNHERDRAYDLYDYPQTYFPGIGKTDDSYEIQDYYLEILDNKLTQIDKLEARIEMLEYIILQLKNL